MTDTSGYDDSLVPVDATPTIDPVTVVDGFTQLPVMQTLVDSIFNQASKPEVDPNTGKVTKPPVGNTLDDIVAFGKNVTSQMQGIVGTVQGIADRNNQVAAETQKAIADSGLQDKTIQDILAVQKMKAEKQNSEFAGALGLDPNQSTYTLLKEGEQLRQQRLDLEVKGEEAQKEASASLFTDPLTFLKTSILGPVAQKSFKVASERYNQQVAAIRESEAMLGDVSVRNMAVDQVTTAQGIAAADKKLADEAIIRANASKQDALKFDLSVINPAMAATKQQWDQMMDINRLIAQHQSMDMEKDSLELRKQEASVNDMIKQEHLDALKDKKDAEAAMDERIQKMNQVFGTNVNGFAEWKTMDSKQQDLLRPLMVSASTGGTGGVDTPDAIRHFKMAPRGPNIGLDNTMRKLENEIATGQSHPGSAPGTPVVPYHQLSPEMQNYVDNQSVKNYIKRELANVSQGGIYGLPSLSKVLALPQVMNTETAKELAPLATNPTYGVDPAQVFAASKKLFMEGKLKAPQLAAEATTLFRSGMVLNNATNGYRALDVPILDPSTTGYKVNIPGVGVVDVSNPISYENALTRAVLRDKVGTKTSMPGDVFAPAPNQPRPY